MLQNQLCSVKITRFYFLFLYFCESLQVGITLASQYMISTSSQNISDDCVLKENPTHCQALVENRNGNAKKFFLNV